MIEEHIAPDQTRLNSVFKIQNNSDSELNITRIDAPCSCMSAKIIGGTHHDDQSVTLAPNEKAEVHGIFTLGNMKGSVDKKIKLWLEGDPKQKPSITLTTRAIIPYAIAAFPQSHNWKKGEEAEEKEILIKVAVEKPINITSTICTSKQIDFKLETIKEGYEYKITAKPKSTEKAFFSAIRIKTDSKNPRFKHLQCFLAVKP